MADDNERTSDTTETFGSQSPSRGVSDQNAEAEPAPGAGGKGRERADREASNEGNPGAAGEGSQATGDPHNAG